MSKEFSIKGTLKYEREGTGRELCVGAKEGRTAKPPETPPSLYINTPLFEANGACPANATNNAPQRATMSLSISLKSEIMNHERVAARLRMK